MTCESDLALIRPGGESGRRRGCPLTSSSAQGLTKEFGREVGTVWPYHGASFVIEFEYLEKADILDRLEHFSPQLWCKVDVAGLSIIKAQSQRVALSSGDGLGAGHCLSGHLESFDRRRRLSPRRGADWCGDLNPALRQRAEFEYPLPYAVPRRRVCGNGRPADLSPSATADPGRAGASRARHERAGEPRLFEEGLVNRYDAGPCASSPYLCA